MVSGPTALSSTYTPPDQVRFRPDPGEPAVNLSAKEHNTAVLVHAQEQRNETRLRAQALARGEDILYSNRTFTLGLGSLSPVFNSGLATVVSRVSDSNIPAITPNQAAEDEQANEAAEEGDDTQEPALSLRNPLVTDDEESQDIEREKQELDNEQARLERNLDIARLKQQQALQQGNPAQFEQARREEAELEREREEVDRDKREAELKEMELMLQEALEMSGGAIQQNANAAIGLLDALFGLDPEDDGQSTSDQSPAGPGFFARAPRL